MPIYTFTLLLTAILLPIAWVDARHHIIPDFLNFLLGVLGILHIYAQDGLNAIPMAAFSASIVAIFFLGLRQIYSMVRGQTGLGLGDVKFLIAATLWIGPLGLPWLVLFASISGLAWHLVANYQSNSASLMQRIAFGPHLAVGFLLAWVWQPHGLL